MVDKNAQRVNQAAIILLLSLAFILDLPILVAVVGAIMLIGTAWPALALFQRFYRGVLLPAKLLRPAPVREDPAAPRFAQGFGSVVLLAATIALLADAPTAGWVLVL